MTNPRVALLVCFGSLWWGAGCDRDQPGTPAAPPALVGKEPTTEPPAKGVEAVDPEMSTVLEHDEPELGTLKMRFEYGGPAFEPERWQVGNKAVFCGKLDLLNEGLLVHPDNKGIRNVVVYVYTGRGGVTLPDSEGEAKVINLANENCRFEPRIVISRIGDTLRVDNPDDVAHNANLSFFNNKPQNLLIPPQQHKDIELLQDEPGPIPVDCNIHPWMRGYVFVLTHSLAAVSDEHGDLEIAGLPVGKKLVFRVFHESGSINHVEVDGQQQEWKRSRFELPIEAGVNDIGTVIVPVEALERSLQLPL